MHRHLALLALLLTVPATACTTSSAADASASGATSVAATANGKGRAVEITASDAMKFNVTEIAVKPGERLSVTLVNLGTMPKFSMGHNWIVLMPGTNAQAFIDAAANAPTTDYVPVAAYKGRILAATKLLGPKERDTVTFTAPVKPGRYEFFCSFPGHYQVGMRGVLIVK